MNFIDKIILTNEQRTEQLWNETFETSDESDKNDIIEENEYFVIMASTEVTAYLPKHQQSH